MKRFDSGDVVIENDVPEVEYRVIGYDGPMLDGREVVIVKNLKTKVLTPYPEDAFVLAPVVAPTIVVDGVTYHRVGVTSHQGNIEEENYFPEGDGPRVTLSYRHTAKGHK